VTTEEKLAEELRRALQHSPEPVGLLVLADRMGRLDSTIRLLSMARELGFENAWVGARPPLLPAPRRN
jgi:hypothetical protein